MKSNVQENCAFCRIAHSNTSALQEYDQPIIETDNFFVVPALGQFTEGYLLICPRAHFLNTGSMDINLIDQFLAVKEQVRVLLREVYGRNPVFFEHGAASTSIRGGTCVDHAHLHAIPVELVDPGLWSSECLIGSEIKSLDAIIQFAKTGAPYFFIESSDGKMYLYDGIWLPCQYGRRVFTRIVWDAEKWDWRKYPYKAKAIKTARQLKIWIGERDDAHNSHILRTAG